MKTTVVPAQVTTVEDRIMGNLGFSQLMLLIVPLFIGAGLFVLLPPHMSGSLYKYIIITSTTVISASLALRIGGKIVAHWLVLILRYQLRPGLYLYDKNTSTGREEYEATRQAKRATAPLPATITQITAQKLQLHEAARVYAAIANPSAQLRFETTKKGGLHVHLTKTED